MPLQTNLKYFMSGVDGAFFNALLRFICSGIVDGFVGPHRVFRKRIAGANKVRGVLPKWAIRFVLAVLNGRLFDRPVRPLDPAVDPGVARLGKPLFDVEVGAA